MAEWLSTIYPSDARSMAKADRLLEQEGIRRDRNLDYICGLFDDEGDLIATGSCFKNTIRCLAVSGEHQGEGLLNRVVGHLMEVQIRRGNSHVFLCTKCQSARFFSDLGFYEIARVDGQLVFMENRRTGFLDYCADLARSRTDGVSAAVVMHANPFTRGHLHLAERAAEENDTVHLFVLSEEASPIPFAVRRALVERGVAHLPNVIVHDSGPYIISAATFPSYFLRDEETVARAHARLDVAVFGRIAASLHVKRRYVGEEPSSGVTACYNAVMSEELPRLGIECRVIPRLTANGRVISASTVRQAIHDGALDAVLDMLPPATAQYFASPEAEPVIAAIRAETNVIHH
ncbi:MAG: [Oscillospiraceae bacterium]|nr:[citrate (pro-3S)-lyase] ligase [Oscillospiraceae bacterium]